VPVIAVSFFWSYPVGYIYVRHEDAGGVSCRNLTCHAPQMMEAGPPLSGSMDRFRHQLRRTSIMFLLMGHTSLGWLKAISPQCETRGILVSKFILFFY